MKNNLTPDAQDLRKNMTRQERRLWYDFLKMLPVPVKRQKVIKNYIVDFYIPEYKIVIELDGFQHYESPGIHNDKKRDCDLNSMGLTVLRYSNHEVNTSFAAVCQDILNHMK